MRAAVAAGWPPTVMWGTGKIGRVSEIDLLLVEALAEYERGLCKGCGHPLLLTTAEDVHPLDFRVQSVTCAGCAVMKDDPEVEHPHSGQLFYVVNNSQQRSKY